MIFQIKTFSRINEGIKLTDCFVTPCEKIEYHLVNGSQQLLVTKDGSVDEWLLTSGKDKFYNVKVTDDSGKQIIEF